MSERQKAAEALYFLAGFCLLVAAFVAILSSDMPTPDKIGTLFLSLGVFFALMGLNYSKTKENDHNGN